MSVNRKIISQNLSITANSLLCTGFSSGTLIFTPKTSTQTIKGRTHFFYKTYENSSTGIKLIFSESLKLYQLIPTAGDNYSFPSWSKANNWTENSDSTTTYQTTDKLYFSIGNLLLRQIGKDLKFHTQ